MSENKSKADNILLDEIKNGNDGATDKIINIYGQKARYK